MKLAGKEHGDLGCSMTHRLSSRNLGGIEIGDKRGEYQVFVNLTYSDLHQRRNNV